MADSKIIMVHKVYAQHSSLVVVIPLLITSELKLDAGDNIVFELDRDTNKVQMSKFETKGHYDGQDVRNTD